MSHHLKSLYYLLSLILLLFLIKSCATPMAPTGGEPDRTGPRVLETYPPSGTTNFEGNEVRFKFDKFVDRNSFRQNISVEPDLGIEFEVDFSRRTGIVSFSRPLPENTTIIVQAGTDVTDTNRNKMERPYEIALSTGDVLDEASITARILDATTGRGDSGKRIFLYREPYDLTQRANYVAQTDTSGRANFGYIAEGTYKAFWVDDINRNRIWDRNRERAQPFRFETFDVAHGDSMDLGTLYFSAPDTVAPRIEGVGLLSEKRLRLRLSEKVTWRPGAFLSVTDTLENEITRAYPLYESEDEPTVVFAQSVEPLGESQTFTLKPEGFTDRAGNRLRVDFSPFSGSAEPDTTILRTVFHNAGSGLFPDEALEVAYTKFIDDNNVVDSLQVVAGDQVIDNWPYVELDRHILRIIPDENWESGIRYQFRVWNPWEEDREQIEPDIWQLGGIEITMENDDPDVLNYVTLTDRDESIRVDTTFADGTLLIDNLPPLEYKIIVFEDVNENGRWDPGVVDPYERPEPYAIRQSVPVREGFTSEVEMVFPPRDTGPEIIEDDPDEVSEAEDEPGEEIEIIGGETEENRNE
jgi:hypothetical protein